MNKILPLLFIAACALFADCNKQHEDCTGINLGTISFTPQELLIHPYGLGDSLVFLNEHINKSISFVCTDQISSYQLVGENEPDSNGYTGCLGDFYNKEVYLTRFFISSKHYIILSAYTRNPFDTLNSANGLQISISVPGDSIYLFDGMYGFTGDTLFNYPDFPAAQIENFYDTLQVANKEYHNVYSLKGATIPNETERITHILYSIPEGILRFSTNQGNVWDLHSKKRQTRKKN